MAHVFFLFREKARHRLVLLFKIVAAVLVMAGCNPPYDNFLHHSGGALSASTFAGGGLE